jgi:[ribosomal protein S5]-alanine N-acetyltransferase
VAPLPRLRLVQLDAATLAALADGDLRRAELTAPVPLSAWLAGEECTGTWRRRAKQVVESPEDAPWVTGVVWDEAGERAVGRAGFHAAPDAAGMVEVGYAIDPAHRRRGYARAALEAMLARARRDDEVRTVRASVSPDNRASRALIDQYGFAEVGQQWDEEDGLEVVLELDVTQDR